MSIGHCHSFFFNIKKIETSAVFFSLVDEYVFNGDIKIAILIWNDRIIFVREYGIVDITLINAADTGVPASGEDEKHN